MNCIALTAIYVALGLIDEMNNYPQGFPVQSKPTPPDITAQEMINLYKLYNPENLQHHDYTLSVTKPHRDVSHVLRIANSA